MGLRHAVDSNDVFMTGHGIERARTYRRSAPSWVLDEKKIRRVLLRAFPKLATDERQRHAAARWAAVIHLFHRMKYTETQVADELETSKVKVHNVIRSIARVGKGLRSDGGGKRGKRGRPVQHK